MQVKRKSRSRKISRKTILYFLVVMVVGYLPVSSFLFALKNDAFAGYFPAKYFLSEALHFNAKPWWNPFINFGLPAYGDMNSGFYSPITWLFASAFKYNAYSFTAELLIYLFLSGIGMYQACRSFKFTKTVSYISGFAFMCSGYMVGHLQHFNWISGAAFLPWCVWGYNQLINNYSLKNNIVCSLIFYFFISSAHPGLIIGALYFFPGFAIYQFFYRKKEDPQHFSRKSFLRKNAWMLALLTILSLGLIMGYSDIIPHITRGKKIAHLSNIVNPLSPQSFLSLLIPFATVKGDSFFMTDISMRNLYFGMTLLLFFIFALKRSKNGYQKFFLYAGAFFLVLSLGGIFKYVTATVLPLIGYVRLPGEFSIFAIFSFILFSAFSLNEFIITKSSPDEYQFRVIDIFKLLLIVLLAIGGIGIILGKSVVFDFMALMTEPGLVSKLKFLVDHISFFDALALQSLLQLGFINSIKSHIKRRTYRELIKLCAVEMVVVTLLNVPFTGVGQTSVSEVQKVLNKSPEGFQTPYDIPVYRNSFDNVQGNIKVLGDWTFYNKQIGGATRAFYPVELNTSKIVYKDAISMFSYKPFVFATNDSVIEKMKITYFKAGMLDLNIVAKDYDTIVFQQNIYPHWRVIVNGEKMKPITYAGVFNAARVAPGLNNVQFIFKAPAIDSGFTISEYAFLACLLYLLIVYIRRSSPL